MRRLIQIIVFCGLSGIALSQPSPWATLSIVDKTTAFDDFLGMEVVSVTPGPIAKTLNQKEIEISGYMIALDVKRKQTHFMFSRYPQNMCFFCGAAGPESAMQVFMANKVELEHTTDKILIKGILNVQQGDPTGLIYTLTQAEYIDVIK